MVLSRASREWAIDLFLVSPKGAIVDKISPGKGRRGRLPQVQELNGSIGKSTVGKKKKIQEKRLKSETRESRFSALAMRE
jgi:hypothetical protein